MNAFSDPCLPAPCPCGAPEESRAPGAAAGLAPAAGAAAAAPLPAAAEPAGWPDSLLDRCFLAWAQRAEARWVQQPSSLLNRYY